MWLVSFAALSICFWCWRKIDKDSKDRMYKGLIRNQSLIKAVLIKITMRSTTICWSEKIYQWSRKRANGASLYGVFMYPSLYSSASSPSSESLCSLDASSGGRIWMASRRPVEIGLKLMDALELRLKNPVVFARKISLLITKSSSPRCLYRRSFTSS